MQRRWIWKVAAIWLSAVVVFGCGEDPVEPPAPLFVPETWAGLWRITLTSRDCGEDSVVAVDVLNDSVCTGQSLVEFLGLQEEDLQLTCEGTWTDTDLSATCTGTSQAFGCDLDLAGSITATLAADVFAGNLRLNLRLNCDGEIDDDCIDAELSAERIAPEPANCPTPTTGSVAALLARFQSQK